MKRLIISRLKIGQTLTIKFKEEKKDSYIFESQNGDVHMIAPFPELIRALEIIDDPAPIIEITKLENGEYIIYQCDEWPKEEKPNE